MLLRGPAKKSYHHHHNGNGNSNANHITIGNVLQILRGQYNGSGSFNDEGLAIMVVGSYVCKMNIQILPNPTKMSAEIY